MTLNKTANTHRKLLKADLQIREELFWLSSRMGNDIFVNLDNIYTDDSQLINKAQEAKDCIDDAIEKLTELYGLITEAYKDRREAI